MEENRRILKWLVFVSACVRVFFVSGSLKANGVILDDLVHKLHSSNSLVAWSFSLQNGCSMLFTPAGTMLLRIFNHRQLSSFGGFLAGAGYILSGLYAEEIWHLFATYTLSGIGFGLVISTGYLALKENFPDNISTVSSFAELFHFVGMACLPPVLSILRSAFGLNNSLILLGALMWNLVPCGVVLTVPKNTNAASQSEGMKDLRDDDVKEELVHSNNKTKESLILTFMEKYFPFFLPFYYHKNFRYLVTFSFIGQYVYTSWVIFLVSLGTSLDLPMDQAVFLSTVGGIGGLLGKLLAAILFYYDKASVYAACLPFLTNTLSMVVVVFMRSYFIIAGLTLITGFSQGLGTGVLFGYVPLIVCSHHFPSAFSVVLLLGGIAIQISGLFSGFLRDAFGSTVYIFVFDAMLCLAVLPLMIPWVCGDQTVEKCGRVETKIQLNHKN